MPTAAWITVDSCITDYLDESEQPIHKYAKCENLAMRGMDELGLDFFYRVKTVRLPVSSTRTAQLPSDFLNYSKIGVRNGSGQIVPLIFNGNLSTFNSLGSRSGHTSIGYDYDFTWNVFSNYYDDDCGEISNIYGIPGGAPFFGSFNVDMANNVIVFDLGFHYSDVFMEYLAAPESGGVHYIPIQFREALISYLRWKDVISLPSSRKGGLGDKKQRENDFFRDRRNAIARWKPLRLDQKYIWSLASTRLCVKG